MHVQYGDVTAVQVIQSICGGLFSKGRVLVTHSENFKSGSRSTVGENRQKCFIFILA